MADFLTVTQAAKHLTAHFGCKIPIWKVRRTVDGMAIDVPRAGNIRLIPLTALDPLAESLRPWVAAHREMAAAGCENG